MSAVDSVIDAVNQLIVTGFGHDGISAELADAWTLGPPRNPPRPNMSDAETHVLSWLQKFADTMTTAGTKFRVDRRGIAGAIAWEALMNVSIMRFDGFGRWCGPGKVHYSTNRGPGEGDPLSKQVEAAGYVDRVSMDRRCELLRDPATAITYIAACMAALADVTADFGFNIRCDPIGLTWAYHGKDLATLRERLQQHQAGTPLDFNSDPPDKSMAVWLKDPVHLAFVQAAVGPPDPAICTPAHVGPPSG